MKPYFYNLIKKVQISVKSDNIEFEKFYIPLDSITKHSNITKAELHVKYKDCDELYFRDYLNDNIEVAKEYEKLKLYLYNKYNPNRDLYTEGKTDFVIKIVKLAREKYKDRY